MPEIAATESNKPTDEAELPDGVTVAAVEAYLARVKAKLLAAEKPAEVVTPSQATAEPVVEPIAASPQPAPQPAPQPVPQPVPQPITVEPVVVTPPEVVAEIVEAEPAGESREFDPAAAAPGEIVQLICMFSGAAVLRKIRLAEGLEVVMVIIGRDRFSAPTWQGCYGRAVPAQSFLICLAKNTTSSHLVARGTCFVDGGSAAVAAAPKPSIQPVQISEPVTAGATPAAATGPLVPGSNEVAILMQRGECDRLLTSLRGGNPITPHETPSLIRQLEAALKR